MKGLPAWKYFLIMKKTLLILIAIAGLTLFVSCAHQGTPSGGPDDKTAPTVAGSTPKAGSVNVPVKSRISITFSEWLSKNSNRGISVYPPFKFKAQVNRNRLDIIPLENLRDSTTYHISITSQLQDLHSNSILAPLSLTFSTGAQLDSGKLGGCVVDPSKKSFQPKVALFKKENLTPDSSFCGQPDYLLQTDSLGKFQFYHIKSGSYYAVAFIDANSDNRIKPVDEAVYSTADSLVTISKTTEDIYLFLSSFDTTQQALKNVKAQSSTELTGEWIVPFDLRGGYSYPKCIIEPVDSPSVKQTGNYIPLSNGRFCCMLKTPMKIQPYRLIYTMRTPSDTDFTDTLPFNGIDTKDTVLPKLLSGSPAEKSTTDLDPKIMFIWSKPVILNTPLLLADSTGNDSILLKSNGGYCDTTFLPLKRKLRPSSKYRMIILSNMGNDMSGNLLKSRDSTDTVSVIDFSTTSEDSLAIMLKGSSTCPGKSVHRKWMFRPLNRQVTYISRDSSSFFRFDSIFGGKGIISYFDDLNENDKIDNGRLRPWIGPEPYFTAPDTIEARARWEIDGVEVKACDLCAKPAADTVKVDTTAVGRRP